MPSSFAACLSSFVTLMSWGLGEGSPLGWLWATMRLGTPSTTAGLSTSAGPDDGGEGVPLIDDALADHAVAAIEQQHAHLLLAEGAHLRSEEAVDILRAGDGRAFRPRVRGRFRPRSARPVR